MRDMSIIPPNQKPLSNLLFESGLFTSLIVGYSFSSLFGTSYTYPAFTTAIRFGP